MEDGNINRDLPKLDRHCCMVPINHNGIRMLCSPRGAHKSSAVFLWSWRWRMKMTGGREVTELKNFARGVWGGGCDCLLSRARGLCLALGSSSMLHTPILSPLFAVKRRWDCSVISQHSTGLLFTEGGFHAAFLPWQFLFHFRHYISNPHNFQFQLQFAVVKP